MKISFSAKDRRMMLLGLIAASIVGWGCAIPVTVATRSDTTVRDKYRPAAEKNDAMAQLQLALAYRFGTAGAAKDPAQAWQWLNRAAQNGLLEAQLMLGDALVSGSWGQAKDIEAGLNVLRGAAQDGRRDVQEHLGMTLRQLAGGGHDAEAAQWFEKAARAGNKHAAMQLGQLYDRGLGVKQDRALAYAWFTVADDAINTGRMDSGLSKDELSRAQQKITQLREEIAK
ncbi:MAG: sel1 repeat family protein [Desulfovibrionaceae bacterium]|nr:sel1 repeat family protein [Desulfovibrionaceae bacterium]